MAPKKGLGGVVYGYGNGYGSEYATREKYLVRPGEVDAASAAVPITPAPRRSRPRPSPEGPRRRERLTARGLPRDPTGQ